MDLISREAAVTAIKAIRESIDVSRDPRDTPDGWVGNYGIRMGLSMGLREVKFLPSPWVSVKDRLPDEDSCVLAYDFVINEVVVAWLYDGVWHGSGYAIEYDVSHWMPLPEPPAVN